MKISQLIKQNVTDSWNATNVYNLISNYAKQNGLRFELVTKKNHVDPYGSKTTAFIFRLGEKDVVVLDVKVTGSPRLNDFRVYVGDLVAGTDKLKNAYSTSKHGSWGPHSIVDMLDKVFKKEK